MVHYPLDQSANRQNMHFGNRQNAYELNNQYYGNNPYYSQTRITGQSYEAFHPSYNPNGPLDRQQNVYSSNSTERIIPRVYVPRTTEWQPSRNHRYLDVEGEYQDKREWGGGAFHHPNQAESHYQRESHFEYNRTREREARSYWEHEGDRNWEPKPRNCERISETNDCTASMEGKNQWGSPVRGKHYQAGRERQSNGRDRDRSRNSSRERRQKRETSNDRPRTRERSASKEGARTRERSRDERMAYRSPEGSKERGDWDGRSGRSERYGDRSGEGKREFRSSADSVDPNATGRYSRNRRGGHFRHNHQDRKYRVPYNWKDIEPIGEMVKGTNIVAMKVPLIKLFTPKVTWTPQDFLEKAKEKGYNVGMVIDLTNTSKYYNGHTDFKSEGEAEEDVIQYHKLPIQGHMEVPPEETIQQFVNLITNFEKKNPDKHIVVHCTHGLNRTGYLIAHYLIRVKGLSVAKALELFAQSRPPGLIKQDYVEDLYKKYAPEEKVIEPEMPAWALEKYSWEKAPNLDVPLNSSVSSNEDLNVDMSLSI